MECLFDCFGRTLSVLDGGRVLNETFRNDAHGRTNEIVGYVRLCCRVRFRPSVRGTGLGQKHRRGDRRPAQRVVQISEKTSLYTNIHTINIVVKKVTLSSTLSEPLRFPDTIRIISRNKLSRTEATVSAWIITHGHRAYVVKRDERTKIRFKCV